MLVDSDLFWDGLEGSRINYEFLYQFRTLVGLRKAFRATTRKEKQIQLKIKNTEPLNIVSNDLTHIFSDNGLYVHSA